MPNLRRFLSRRRLLAVLGIAAFLFGVAMLHPYPRQSLFGPTIRGKPWCVWEAEVRHWVHKVNHQVDRPYFDKVLGWLHIEPNSEDVDGDNLNHQDFLPLLIAMADDPDQEVRYAVLSWINRGDNLHDSSVVPALKKRLNDDDSGCRIEAAMALWKIAKDRQAIELMLRELKDTSKPRYVVMRFFGDICDDFPEHSIHLIPLTNDEDSFVRSHAMLRMYQFGKKGLPILLNGLDDPDADVRKCAACSLWSLGPDAKAAVPALERRLKDNEKEVRRRAVLALKKIEPARFQHLVLEPRW